MGYQTDQDETLGPLSPYNSYVQHIANQTMAKGTNQTISKGSFSNSFKHLLKKIYSPRVVVVVDVEVVDACLLPSYLKEVLDVWEVRKTG